MSSGLSHFTAPHALLYVTTPTLTQSGEVLMDEI